MSNFRRTHVEKRQVLFLMSLLLVTMGMTACNRATTPGPTAERPVIEEQRQEEVAQMPPRAERAETRDIHRLQDAENNLSKTVTDVEVSARLDDVDKYRDHVSRAYQDAEGTIRELAQAAVNLQPAAEQPVAEAPFGLQRQELPTDLKAKLDRLHEMGADRNQAFNVTQVQQRWMAMADLLQDIQARIPDSQVASMDINRIRTLARQMTEQNQMATEVKLFTTLDTVVGTLAGQVENRYISMLPVQQPVREASGQPMQPDQPMAKEAQGQR